ncbi:hypothetical protein CCHL11_08958 [Colletotrichum chlorophyti]|uniref:Uncharacterized protein n=1 Tax=Colletotrichum chlorophyti TaxID=708187 RepID=A0A1Q8RS19_9PEZI|nr:hypothetical protein CCHL11_08958 [Colletotrichum chlorophyti]
MDGILRTLIRSRDAAPSPTRGSRDRNRTRHRRDDDRDRGGGGSGNHSQIELVLEMLARGLVELAVRKYITNRGGEDRHRDDRRVSTRENEDRNRGGVPNMDVEMFEHLGRNILSKAMEHLGGGDGKGEQEQVRANGRGRDGERGPGHRDSNSRERSRDESRDRDHNRGRRRHSRDRFITARHRGGSPTPSRRHPDDDPHRRRRRRTDYAPLVENLETLSNALISLNERQPGHADCEFYDAFVERSGKVQESIGAVLTQIREREERRGRRRR